jgi:hypothetical protein
MAGMLRIGSEPCRNEYLQGILEGTLEMKESDPLANSEDCKFKATDVSTSKLECAGEGNLMRYF